MILPKSLLDEVKYYEVNVVDDFGQLVTKITLHFKQWWKFRKTFKFRWSLVSRDNEAGNSVFRQSEDAAQLEKQLEEYFKGK